MKPPREIKKGDPLRGTYFRDLSRFVESLEPGLPSGAAVTHLGGGVIFEQFRRPRIGSKYTPPFWVYDASTTAAAIPPDAPVTTFKVKVTAGNVAYPFTTFKIVPVAASSALTVVDGDFVWLEMTAAKTWGFNVGASLPLDRLRITLAAVAITDDVMTISRKWDGGDIVLQPRFPVALEKTGGSAGDGSTRCSFTYTVKSLAGDTILTEASPLNSGARTVKCKCTAGTKGDVFFGADGALNLWSCDEKQTQCVGTCDA
jgi:hypothetical protein